MTLSLSRAVRPVEDHPISGAHPLSTSDLLYLMFADLVPPNPVEGIHESLISGGQREGNGIQGMSRVKTCQDRLAPGCPFLVIPRIATNQKRVNRGSISHHEAQQDWYKPRTASHSSPPDIFSPSQKGQEIIWLLMSLGVQVSKITKGQ